VRAPRVCMERPAACVRACVRACVLRCSIRLWCVDAVCRMGEGMRGRAPASRVARRGAQTFVPERYGLYQMGGKTLCDLQ
jgi:hypothetical protein